MNSRCARRRSGQLEKLESRVLLAGDLVGHWRGQELTDGVADGAVVAEWADLTSDMVASAEGQPTLIHDGIDGRSVLRFDAGDGVDLFRVPGVQSPLKGAADFSISVVFRTASNNLVGDETRWFDNTGLVDGSQLGFTTDWGLSITSAGKVAGGMGESFVSPPKSVYSAQSGLNDGAMHTATLVRQGSDLTIYVDGVNQGSRSDASSQDRSQIIDFVMGGLETSSNGFTGDIAEVRVYNGVLNSGEVSQLHTDLSSYYDNEAPVAAPDTFQLVEDGVFFSPQSILANDVDADGDPLSAVLVSDSSHGRVSLTETGTFLYVPEMNYFGIDSFTYAANDFRDSNVVTVTLEIAPSYDPAIPRADQFETEPGEVLQIPAIVGVLANDENPDGASLKAVVTNDVNFGSLTLEPDGAFVYDPQGLAGLAEFSYQIDDGTGLSVAQAVSILVNTPPSGTDDQLSVVEDIPFALTAANGLLSNDQDADGDAITAELLSDPERGDLTFEADGAIHYASDLNYYGSDSFTYRLSDGIDTSEVITVNLTIEAVDDAPIASDDGYFAAPGQGVVTTLSNGVLANDSDVDSSGLTVELVQPPANGTLDLKVDGTFTYNSAEDFVGTDSFIYRVSDGNSNSEQAEVSLFVGASPLQITEFMTANVGEIETRLREDAGGRYRGDRTTPDWIEIKNLSSSKVDISGFHLTDDEDNKTKWAFPDGTQIDGSGYLVVYATQLNMADPNLDETGRLHTNFGLTLDGEYLALAGPAGSVLSEFGDEYPEQRPGVSYGIASGGSIGYLTSATPGADNGTAYPGLVADTKFSVDRGLYDQQFEVEIVSSTAAAEIRYTFDGSAPTADHGNVYAGPISIDRTTTLRAAAFYGDYLGSNVDTQTYVFVDQVIDQSATPKTGPTGSEVEFPERWRSFRSNYEMDADITQSATYSGRMRDALVDLPTLSLTLDQEDVFGAKGLYSNPGGTNEAAASAELIYPDGEIGFQIDAGARMQGGASRNTEHVKHSMSLRFREQYGAGSLEYPLFEDSPVDTFNAIHLRARYNNSWIHWDQGQRNRGSMMREAWARDTMLAAGDLSAGYGDYVHLYLNGLYWGVYEMHERQDASHVAAYFGGEAHEYDALNGGAFVDGNDDSYDRLGDIVRSKNWGQIQEVLDVDNHIMFNIVQLYGGNQDLKTNGNWRMAGGGTGEGLWRFYMWDVERILESTSTRGTSPVSDLLGFRGRLDDIEEYRVRFADHVHRMLYNDGVLTPENAAARWMNRAGELDLAIVAESARWGDTKQRSPQTRDEHWIKEQNRLIDDYFPVRTDKAISNFRRANLYPDTDAPEFLVDGNRQHGGFADSAAVISFDNPNANDAGQLLYTLDGSDPRLEGGEISATAVVYAGGALPVAGSGQLRARIKNGTEWSALTDATFAFEIAASAENLAISELNYNPHDGMPSLGEPDLNGNAFEFIELQNIGDVPVSLAGVQLRQISVDGESEGVRFDFAAQTLAPGEYRVVVRNQDAFATRYGPNVRLAAGNDGLNGPQGVWGGGRLGDGGEMLSLFSADGEVIRQFRYDDEGAWPERADGIGSTLVLSDSQADGSQGGNWVASDLVGGTPGAADQGFAEDVVINEILTNTDAPQIDQVELLNVSGAAVDVSQWYVSDTANNLTRFQLAEGLTPLNPGDSLVLDESQLGFGFKGQANDDIWLVAATADDSLRFADSASFLATETGVSLGRWPNGEGGLFPQQTTTFGAPNSGPLLNGPIISEVNYNPTTPADETTSDAYEYVEVWNPTASPLDVTGWRLGKAVDFSFPEGTTVGPNRGLVAVSFDPADVAATTAFRTHYAIAADVELIGPFSGVLDNGGENLELQRTVAGDDSEFILVDRVRYEDDQPWPGSADGAGDSLNRLAADSYGDLVSSWLAAVPTPGTASFGPNPADLNRDGNVDVADIDFMSDRIRAQDLAYDRDQNGILDSDDLIDFVTGSMGSPMGDSNLDRRFDSSDFVLVFQAGKYEDGVAGNSSWAEGDWNADGDFDTQDFVFAFQQGEYVSAATPLDSQLAAAILSQPSRGDVTEVETQQDSRNVLPELRRARPLSEERARDMIFGDFQEDFKLATLDSDQELLDIEF
ncbi:MAG: Ig-like domain-containing protein [Pirellulaceae bacterium]|nr:Ig-like domain-containing protein [Pirellulaceae bacterium]